MNIDGRWSAARGFLVMMMVPACVHGLLRPAQVSATEVPAPCRIDSRALGSQVPLVGGDGPAVCLVEALMTAPTTAGTVGPVQTRLDTALYGYLLDHPDTTARLVSALNLAPHRVTAMGAGTYAIDDQAGGRGTFRVLIDNGFRRIYYLQGSYERAFWPVLRGDAILFLTAEPAGESPVTQGMRTTIRVYTRLEPSVVSGLIWLFRPLIEGAISKRIAGGLLALTRLGEELATHPDRVVHAVTLLPDMTSADRAALLHVLSPGVAIPSAGTSSRMP